MPGTVLRLSELEFPPQIPILACILPSTGGSLPTLAFRPTLVHSDSCPNSSFWSTGTRSARQPPLRSTGMLGPLCAPCLRGSPSVVAVVSVAMVLALSFPCHGLFEASQQPRDVSAPSHFTQGDAEAQNDQVTCPPGQTVASTALPHAAPGPHPLPGHLLSVISSPRLSAAGPQRMGRENRAEGWQQRNKSS